MFRYYILLSFFVTFFAVSTLLAQNSNTLTKVVIDPGHGGNQPGAVWGKYKEKDITLSVSKKLGALINKAYPDIEVIYTRQDDRAVDLYKRGEIANNAAADLFISIHVNASRNTSAGGTETFVMGAGKSDQNLEVAMAENSVISYEDDFQTKYEGFDPGSAESYIIFSLMQYSYLEQSLKYAAHVQDFYDRDTPMKNRGVKQAGFLVLWNTAMPSVLTEIGFISNSSDRAYLVSSKGQDVIAASLFKAFSSYKESLSGGASDVISSQPEPPVKPQEPEPVKIDAQHDLYYAVQILSANKKIVINSRNFGRHTANVWWRKIDGRDKYFYKKVKTYQEALSLQRYIRTKGYKDAFVVAFDGEKQIKVEQARELE